jgi:hypothetical protein
MKTHADKAQSQQRQSTAKQAAEKHGGGESTRQFVSHRPDAIAQRQLQEVADKSRRVQKLMALEELAAHSPRATQDAHTQATTNTYAARQQYPSHNEAVVQRVRGGIEFTEDGPTVLYAYDGRPFPGTVAAHNQFNVGAAPMTGFRVGAGIDANADLGAWTNQDYDVLRTTANVKLTNDVRSAEWIIERHRTDVPVNTMTANLKDDVDYMFQARDTLASEVNSLQASHAGEAAIASGTKANTNAAPVVFIYKPGPKKGKAQITAQYSNEDTIRRINKLNVSKYLTGTKVAVGEDIPRISGTESRALISADVAGTTSFSTADVLLTGLSATSLAIPATAGGTRLTQNQVGIIKLMVLNDALATTMVRYQDVVGQAQEKNIQRFFPKSRRDEYVHTLAQQNLDATEMAALHTEITRTSAADAQLLFNSADPGALRTDEAFTEVGLADPAMAGMLDARRRLANPSLGAANAGDLLNIKTAVLGANGNLLAWWVNQAAQEYTDLTPRITAGKFYDPNKADHLQSPSDVLNYGVGQGGDVGNVLETSRGFTPVAGGGQGAIYEMREREIDVDESGLFNIGSRDELNTAIDRIFHAVT